MCGLEFVVVVLLIVSVCSFVFTVHRNFFLGSEWFFFSLSFCYAWWVLLCGRVGFVRFFGEVFVFDSCKVSFYYFVETGLCNMDCFFFVFYFLCIKS